MAIRVSIPSIHTYHLKGPCAVECYYKDQHIWGRLPLSVAFKTASKEPVVVCAIAYIHRKDDDGVMVTHPCGSAWIDLSSVNYSSYQETPLIDHSVNQQVGMIKWSFDFAFQQPPKGPIQSSTLQRLSDMSENNLRWIAPFHARGYAPIVEGLQTVHSPYYTNHLGIRMPSGTFTLTKTLQSNMEEQMGSFQDRLAVSLNKYGVSNDAWTAMVGTPTSLEILVDFLTMHTNQRVHYTPDVTYRKDGSLVGCERWECPRTDDGVYTGDCEDVAKDLFQQCKELKRLFQPRLGTPLETVSYILHMYIPTIEQGAVTAAAHSRFIGSFESVSYRNHVWAALHPRSMFKKDVKGTYASYVVQSIIDSYKVVPKQTFERRLPRLLLEGTGMVYPVSNHVKDNHNRSQRQHTLETSNALLRNCQTLDFHADACQFYKYSIACMTDVFYAHGILDFTYVTDQRYGVSFNDWYDSKPLHIHVNDKHTLLEQKDINAMIELDRPIPPLVERVTIVSAPDKVDSDALTFSMCHRDASFDQVEASLTDRPRQVVEYDNGVRWSTWFM